VFPSIIAPVARPSYAISGWRSDRSYRGEGAWHEGIDFPGQVGAPVYAVADGVVKYSLLDPGPAGEMIVIQHANGLLSRYMHLTTRAVAAGAQVRQGQAIGTVGTTGTKESGPHVHFDIRVVPEKLAEWVATHGTPTGGFGRNLSGGIAVPAETITPVDKYAPGVTVGAARYGVSLYGAGGVGIGLLLVGGLAAWWYFRGR
jgi:murein DD-endopeptidase MepM/ murein hydrolase activator NlpD